VTDELSQGAVLRRVDGPVCHCVVRTSIATFERWEDSASIPSKGNLRDVGGTPEVKEIAWARVHERGPSNVQAGKRGGTRGGLPLLAGSRIDDRRNLSSPDFDFRKLIRLCEELEHGLQQRVLLRRTVQRAAAYRSSTV